MTEASIEEKAPTREAAPAGAHPMTHYTLFILCLIATFNYIDRQVLSVLLEQIKHELGASDTAMGVLNGLAFSIVYLLAGVPLARMADRKSRRNLLSVCVAIWSGATVLCGATTSYAQLALARMGVAAGEAGANPCSQSMIADLYPREKRGTPLAIWNASTSAGIAFGLFLGGWLAQSLGWRVVFFVVGLPGLILAALLFFTTREPVRSLGGGSAEPPPLGESVKVLWRIKSYRAAILIVALAGVVGNGFMAWAPTMLIRTFDMNVGEVGMWMGTAAITGMTLGHIVAGKLSDVYGKRDPRAYFAIAAGCLLTTIPCALAFTLAPTQPTSIIAFFAFKLVNGMFLVPMYIVVLSLVPSNMRGMAALSLTLATSLLGAGIGPVVIGAVTDALAPSLGTNALRFAMSTLLVSLVVALGAVRMGMRHAQADFAEFAPDS
jgi:MFS family permease